MPVVPEAAPFKKGVNTPLVLKVWPVSTPPVLVISPPKVWLLTRAYGTSE